MQELDPNKEVSIKKRVGLSGSNHEVDANKPTKIRKESIEENCRSISIGSESELYREMEDRCTGENRSTTEDNCSISTSNDVSSDNISETLDGTNKALDCMSETEEEKGGTVNYMDILSDHDTEAFSVSVSGSEADYDRVSNSDYDPKVGPESDLDSDFDSNSDSESELESESKSEDMESEMDCDAVQANARGGQREEKFASVSQDGYDQR